MYKSKKKILENKIDDLSSNTSKKNEHHTILIIGDSHTTECAVK
jgi:hypothetical protein